MQLHFRLFHTGNCRSKGYCSFFSKINIFHFNRTSVFNITQIQSLRLAALDFNIGSPRICLGLCPYIRIEDINRFRAIFSHINGWNCAIFIVFKFLYRNRTVITRAAFQSLIVIEQVSMPFKIYNSRMVGVTIIT